MYEDTNDVRGGLDQRDEKSNKKDIFRLRM